MLSLRTSIATLTLLPVLFFSVAGDDELLLRDHHHLIRGTVVSSTADSVTFDHEVGDHSETHTFTVDDIDPHSFYIIRSRAIGDDAAATAELGRYCAANGLFTRATNLYSAANKLDPSLDLKAEIKECEEGTARQMLLDAQDLAAKNKPSDAFRATAALIRRFPTSSAADEARALNTQLHNGIAGDRQAKRDARNARAAASKLESVQRDVHKDMDRGADANAKGLQASGLGESKRQFNHAIDYYEKAVRALEGLAEDFAADQDVMSQLTSSLAEARSALVDVHLNLGSMYMTHTDYQGALKQANAAIAVDTKSRSARSFRARVASASAESGIEVYGGRIR
jgi:tetratricopeptide (TPR) repeat protein